MFSRTLLFFAFFYYALSLTALAAAPDSTVLLITTRNGMLRGTTEAGVRVWRGVRYAQPPVKELRFKRPQPLQPWQGVADAAKFGTIAPQNKNSMGGQGLQSEDCLFLNIWSPNVSAQKKPVMFWIHGGGFELGSGSADLYNGSRLSKNGDVVVVTINYRLGPLGFLYLDEFNTDSTQFDSNLGLYDQLAALQWVKENIAAFGGDAGNVTIFGESAGANSVLALCASPLAKGLFHKAIVESAAGSIAIAKEKAAQRTRELLDMLGISPSEISKLRTLSVDTLLAASERNFKKLVKERDDILFFVPVYGTDILPLLPKDAIAQGAAKDIPMMIGTNRDEANLFVKVKPPVISADEESVHTYFKNNGIAAYEKQVVSLYPGYPSRATILSMTTDAVYQVPAIHIADAQSHFAPTYSYRFDWTSSLIRLAGLKACHGIELPFVFNTFDSEIGKRIRKSSGNRRIYRLSKQMQYAWSSFAHTGIPKLEKTTWPAYTVESRSTMILDNTLHIVTDPISTRRQGWEAIR